MEAVTERWMESSRRHLEGELRPGIFAHLVTREIWREAFALLEPRSFPSSARLTIPPREGGAPRLVSELEPDAGSRFEHHLVMTVSAAAPTSGQEAVGVYRGYHAPGGIYWMFTSALDPDFQRRGA